MRAAGVLGEGHHALQKSRSPSLQDCRTQQDTVVTMFGYSSGNWETLNAFLNAPQHDLL